MCVDEQNPSPCQRLKKSIGADETCPDRKKENPKNIML